jgi:hypothetical protein
MSSVHPEELTSEDLDALVAAFERMLDPDAGELVVA